MTAGRPEAVLEVRDLVVRAGQQLLLDRVSLRVEAGSILGLIGPNGGGKTTLLRAALGLQPLESGTVLWWGRPLAEARRAGLRIGYVPQRGTWDPRFPISVEEAVLLGLRDRKGVRGVSAADRASAMSALELMEVSHLASHRLASCSGGEIQRVMVARALCLKPHVLILDEPTSAADSAAQDRFYRNLQVEREAGLTVLLVSHDVGMIASIADSVACLNQRLHFHGAPPEVLGQENLSQAYGCELEVLTHGHVPHRTVRRHDVGEHRPGGA